MSLSKRDNKGERTKERKKQMKGERTDMGETVKKNIKIGYIKIAEFFFYLLYVFCYKIQNIKDRKMINTFLEFSRNVLLMSFSSLLLKMAINVCFGVLKLQDVSRFLINF